MKIKDFNLTPSQRSEIETSIYLHKLTHAIIIESGSLSERINFAAFLAAAIICSDSDAAPCEVCRDCKKVFDQVHPDVYFYEREANKKEFSVKLVREKIKPLAFIKPNEASAKVFVIKDAQTMNASAQNALLKILEEPPANVHFILCCDSIAPMLETIRSRSTIYQLQITQDFFEQQDRAWELAASLALSLTSANEFDFMKQTGAFEKDRELLALTIEKMQILFRDALALKNNIATMSNNQAAIQKLSSYIDDSNLINLINELNSLSDLIQKNANLNLLITRFCSVLRQETRR